MPEPASWRELLNSIIRNPAERVRMAHEMGIHSITLTRWANSLSAPRPYNLRQLLDVLPQQHRALFLELIEKESLDLIEKESLDFSD